MGALFRKLYYIDRSNVEWTILSNAEGQDVLSIATNRLLESIPTPHCGTLEHFRITVKTVIEERPKELAYIAVICAYAIKVRNKYKLCLYTLADIIFTELNLPWTVSV